MPTIALGYPSNIPDLPGHNWANAVSMATPIAHKGATAGSKALAMTMVDLLLRPEIIRDAWTYFREVQTKDVKYQPLVAPTDTPATFLNARKMAEYREPMKRYYYDATKYPTYLDQLGISTDDPIGPTVDRTSARSKADLKVRPTCEKVTAPMCRADLQVRLRPC